MLTDVLKSPLCVTSLYMAIHSYTLQYFVSTSINLNMRQTLALTTVENRLALFQMIFRNVTFQLLVDQSKRATATI